MPIEFFKIFFSLILFISILFGQEQVVGKDSIQALAMQVKKASPLQRRILMNQLKIKLRFANRKTRNNMMLNLRRVFNARHNMLGTNHVKTMRRQGSMMKSNEQIRESIGRNMNIGRHVNKNKSKGMGEGVSRGMGRGIKRGTSKKI